MSGAGERAEEAGRVAPGEWPLVARPRKARWAGIVGAVAVLTVMISVAVVLRDTYTGVYFRFADQVAMVLLGMFIGGILLLFAWPRVRAGAAGVEVRNLTSTVLYPWADIQGFGFPHGATWGRVDLDDDEYVPMLAIQVVDGQRSADAMRGLRRMHAEYLREHAP